MVALTSPLSQVGFPKRDPTKLKIAIENTYHLIWIRSTKQVRPRAGVLYLALGIRG
jgi:hypothetical protein